MSWALTESFSVFKVHLEELLLNDSTEHITEMAMATTNAANNKSSKKRNLRNS